MPKGSIYLVPNVISNRNPDYAIPPEIVRTVRRLQHFIVEDLRTARRYLKLLDKHINIDQLQFYLLDKRSTAQQHADYLKIALDGHDMGIISEAGCPGVADPGADIVKLAHENNIRVVPLVGPSSILLAMMASGLNGQNFAFIGYIPIPKNDRVKRIKELESRSLQEKQAQLFIEAPYRNKQLFEDILQSCHPATQLCLAVDITAENEYIKTQTIAKWKKHKPDVQKRPVIFIIQAG